MSFPRLLFFFFFFFCISISQLPISVCPPPSLRCLPSLSTFSVLLRCLPTSQGKSRACASLERRVAERARALSIHRSFANQRLLVIGSRKRGISSPSSEIPARKPSQILIYNVNVSLIMHQATPVLHKHTRADVKTQKHINKNRLRGLDARC